LVKLTIFKWLTAAALVATSMSIAQAACRQALAMGLDVSGSVDAGEYQLQLQGLAAALTSPDTTSSILSVPSAPVRLLIYEWSGQNYQRILIPWTEISNLKTLQNLSTKLHQVQRQDAPPTTALGKAIQSGIGFLNQQTSCWKRTLDISGDGKSNTGPEPHRVNLPEQIDNIVINALVIGVDAGSRLSHAELSISELTAYFSNRVLAGPSAFSEVAVGFADYERAMSRKLLRELELISMSKLDQ
jgi:hypothetical protein